MPPCSAWSRFPNEGPGAQSHRGLPTPVRTAGLLPARPGPSASRADRSGWDYADLAEGLERELQLPCALGRVTGHEATGLWGPLLGRVSHGDPEDSVPVSARGWEGRGDVLSVVYLWAKTSLSESALLPSG